MFLASARRLQLGRNEPERVVLRDEYSSLAKLMRSVRLDPNKDFFFGRSETLLSAAAAAAELNELVVVCAFGFVGEGLYGELEIRIYTDNSRFRHRRSTCALSDVLGVVLRRPCQGIFVMVVVSDADFERLLRSPPQFSESTVAIVRERDSRLAFGFGALCSYWGQGLALAGQLGTRRDLLCRYGLERFVEYASDFFQTDTRPSVLLLPCVASSDSTAELMQDFEPAALEGIDHRKLLFAREEQLLDELNRLVLLAAEPESAPVAVLWFLLLDKDRASKLAGFISRTHIWRALGYPSPTFDFADQVGLWQDAVDEALVVDLAKSFVPICEGEYRIGRDMTDGESEPPAEPAFVVVLAPYRIQRRLFTECDARAIGFRGDQLPGRGDDYPLTGLSVRDAMIVAMRCESLFRAQGLLDESSRVALPTELQWEVAAGGEDGIDYPWGETFEIGRCNSLSAGIGAPSAVRSFSPAGDSPSGCSDMSGNVREWTRTYAGPSIRKHTAYPYSQNQHSLEAGQVLGDEQVIVRGGSYSYDDACVKVWVRNKDLSSQRRADTGFRLVIETVTGRAPLE